MKQQKQGATMPSANLTINKSRLPIYNKSAKMPTYYLTKGQEFQIELFNPTADIILAKIKLNNKSISQGGLVLKPGERVFLERYLDVTKKFLFDTYEVSGGSEAQKAIEQNGDFSVEFFKERQQITFIGGHGSCNNSSWGNNITLTGGNTFDGPNIRTFNSTNTNYKGEVSNYNTTIGLTNNTTFTTNSMDVTLDMMPIGASVSNTMNMSFMDTELSGEVLSEPAPGQYKKRLRSKSKSIETGRVEQGSHSSQVIKQVNYDFEYFPFHTLEYKLLPQSQKVNTSNDIKVRKYCTDCGKKSSKTDKFCSQCGKKQ